MKLSIFPIALAVAITSLTSCSDNWSGADDDPQAPKGYGSADLKSMLVEVNPKITDVQTRATYDVSDYLVTITDADGATLFSRTYKEIDGMVQLPEGKYTISAVSSDNPPVAAFDAPYFAGSKEVEIEAGTIKEVGIVTCNLANLKVSIRFTDELRQALSGEASIKVQVDDSNALTFTGTSAAAPSQAGYFMLNPDSKTLVATFTGVINGTEETVTHPKSEYILPGYHHIITFGLKNPGAVDPDPSGSLTPGITIDAGTAVEDVNAAVTVEEEVLPGEDRPGSDGGDEPDPDPSDPGTGDSISFTSEMSFTQPNDATLFGSDPGQKPAVINIHSENPIAHINVVIDSDVLTADELEKVGLAKEFDLAEPATDELVAGLAGLNFPIRDEVIGQNDVEFNISDFTGLLCLLGESTNNFIITVEDNTGHSRTISLVLLCPAK